MNINWIPNMNQSTAYLPKMSNYTVISEGLPSTDYMNSVAAIPEGMKVCVGSMISLVGFYNFTCHCLDRFCSASVIN